MQKYGWVFFAAIVRRPCAEINFFFCVFSFFEVLRFLVALHDFIKILFTDGAHQIRLSVRKSAVFTDGAHQIHLSVRKSAVFTDGTHQIKNALHCVRVFGLLSGVPVFVKCNSLNISYFLIIGCAVPSTLKYVTACFIGVYVSWSSSTCGRIGRVKLTVARLSPEILFVFLRQSLPSLLQVPVAGAMS